MLPKKNMDNKAFDIFSCKYVELLEVLLETDIAPTELLPLWVALWSGFLSFCFTFQEDDAKRREQNLEEAKKIVIEEDKSLPIAKRVSLFHMMKAYFIFYFPKRVIFYFYKCSLED